MRPFVRPLPNGVELRVRLTPRADRDAIDGVVEFGPHGQVLAARVRAVPEKGAANAALERLVADLLGIAPSSVKLSAGATQRIKVLAVAGKTDSILARLAELGK